MAETSRQRMGELLRKLFEILKAQPEGLGAAQALKTLASSVTLSPYEASFYENSGARRFEKTVRFATIACVKAGWLTKHKGIWSITDEGLSAYDRIKEPAAFRRESDRLYAQWKAAQLRDPSGLSYASAKLSEQSDLTFDVDAETASMTYEQAEEQAWGEIEQHLLKMPPYDFQDLVSDLLRAMSYHIGWVSPPGKDDGVDIIANNDPLGTRPPRIKVQVKRVAHRVDTDGLKSFIAIINEDDVGLFISTGGFTRDAQSFARNQERRKITLIDSERLIELWIQFYSKLDDKARARMPLTPIYFLTPQS
ncbi:MULTISPECIES: restriction endonuclease [unclassified Caballeronia]|uniref:restriction endonuclease n=1 Tax=unclassified Caballeronia TaxID=2646786 RepID=UPI002028D039|nr:MULTISPECIES: restriction endonuclease [unclassified Caballeronia]MDR5776101.1 restriction endonuclease [Caballeronia sp. LZ002]MDR5801015.1 restriction endonuclease [Caballeronia sp. LZ001]MDR5851541.1 restriction endonuclease [Caballeronia sp. LZ003]